MRANLRTDDSHSAATKLLSIRTPSERRGADVHSPHRIDRELVRRDLHATDAMAETRRGSRLGDADMRPLEPSAFRPTAELPSGDYWLEDVDLGNDLLNVVPEDADRAIEAAGRSTLTLEEDIAVLLEHPGILREANCYQMRASSAGDRRVPSLWVTMEGRPRLGWCWRDTPHTWLGAASWAARTPTG